MNGAARQFDTTPLTTSAKNPAPNHWKSIGYNGDAGEIVGFEGGTAGGGAT